MLALHGLAQVNPGHICVAAPHRTRAKLPATVKALRRLVPDTDVTDVDGVPTMTVAAALRACRGRVMTERLLQGVQEALERQLIDPPTAEALRAELADDTGAAAAGPAAVTA